MVPIHSPDTSFSRYVRLSVSLPWALSASIAAMVSIGPLAKPTEAECHISVQAALTICGNAWPPQSAGAVTAFQPPMRQPR